MELVTRRFVRPAFLNHHHTMYAGCISEWVTEAAMIGATDVFGSNENVVLAAVKEVRVLKPIKEGTILEFLYEKGHVGTTSLEIKISGRDFISKENHILGSAVFVNVDKDGKKAPHGL